MVGRGAFQEILRQDFPFSVNLGGYAGAEGGNLKETACPKGGARSQNTVIVVICLHCDTSISPLDFSVK